MIPTYNRAQLLERALETVAAQDYRPVEVVLVDDASDDDTDVVVKSERARLQARGVTLHSRTLAVNSGPAAARNAGLEMATGSLIAFLASDDLWHPTFLSTLVGLLERYPSCGVAFSGHAGIDIDDHVFTLPEAEVGGEDDEGVLAKPFEAFIAGFPFVTAGTLIRRGVLDTVGWFDAALASWEDADLWYRIAKRFDFVYTLARLAYYRLHEGNITKQRLDWYGYQLRVRLRHLDDVQDPAVRKLALERIRRAQVLLQEQLLREGRAEGEYALLLDHSYARTTTRYRVGRLVMHGPSWLRRSYAAGIRVSGNTRRRVQPAALAAAVRSFLFL